MSDILLSICIPTYNHHKTLFNLLNHIILFKSKEIEIIICDDNPFSNRTGDIVNQIQDPRIKYFRNRKNLGYDANFLNCIKKSSGEFIYMQCDDDDIEMDSFPWILKTIKLNKNRNITQLCGTIGYNLLGWKDRFIRFGDRILKQNSESLKELLFYYAHGCGIVLRKEALNLKKARNYIGCLYIQQILIAQAMIVGDTLCTSKIFGYEGEFNTYEHSNQPLFKEQGYWHPSYLIYLENFRVELIYEITNEIQNSKEIRKILLDREIKRIFIFFDKALDISLKTSFESLGIIISNTKISKSPKFWIEFILELVFIRCIKKLKKSQNKIIKYILHQIAKLLDFGRLKVMKFPLKNKDHDN